MFLYQRQTMCVKVVWRPKMRFRGVSLVGVRQSS